MRTFSVLVLSTVLVASCDRPASVEQVQASPQSPPPESEEEKWDGPKITLPTEEAVVLGEGQFASLFPDPNEQAFIASFPGLRRTLRGAVLYAPSRLELVDSARSSFPRTSPMWQDTSEMNYLDDHVVGRLKVLGSDTGAYYLVYTDGMSGDPAFYLMRDTDGEQIGWEAADVLVLPDSGDAWIYQRTNSVFPKRRRIRITDGRMVELTDHHYPVGLQTVALKSFPLRRALDDSTAVAQVAAGDSIEVVEGIDPPRAESVLLVRKRDGSQGWVQVQGQQCNLGVIKGICFLGD